LYLSLILGVPQTLWRARHLWHHAGEPAKRFPLRPHRQARLEFGAIGVLWCLLAYHDLARFVQAYVPGYLIGLSVCYLHGRYEHLNRGQPAQGAISSYGRLYNWLWLNDGYHAEHHRWPAVHWTRLPARRLARGTAPVSTLPPVARWLGSLSGLANLCAARLLASLEHVALRSERIQNWLLAVHEAALRPALSHCQLVNGRPLTIGIVGGGLFPRTALILGRLLPDAQLHIVEGEPSHIEPARQVLRSRGLAAQFVAQTYAADSITRFDVVVIPLGYVGERAALYERPVAPVMLIHDWLWRRRGWPSLVVSRWLLKRLNVVRAPANETADDGRDVTARAA
jgi:hypothetical protein